MSLFVELRRRNVFRMAVLYAISAWLVLQVGDVLFGVLGVPDWSLRLLLAFLALGFPFALIFSWVYELTPEGVRKESEIDRSASVAPQTGRKIDRLIIAVLAIAVAVLLVDRWRGTPTEAESPSPARTGLEATAEPAAETNTRSIAVLPFEDFSGGEDQAWFARGLSEEILNALARAPDLLVASRTSSFRYADSELAVTEIGEELGVAHVLEGSVRRSPDRIRVTAQLIRAADGFHLWSENYDRTPQDVIAIQEDIAQSIAEALETAMNPDALAAMMATGTRSVAAYNAYLEAIARANAMWAEGSLDPQRVIELAGQAVTIDPTFARAHELLARQYRNLANSSVMTESPDATTPAEYRRRFEASLDAAIEHAPNAVDRRNFEATRAHAQQRLALAEDRVRAYLQERPNDARARNELSSLLLSRGKIADGMDAIAPLASGEVLAGSGDLMQAGTMFVFGGDPDQGVALFDQILTSDPQNTTVLYQKHRALLWAGRYDEADEVVAELGRVFLAKNLQANVAIREACADGDRKAAEAILAAMSPDHRYGQWYGNLLLGYRARSAAAFAPLDETEAGLDDLAGYLVHPHFDPTPYPRLMARIADDLVTGKPIVEMPPFACPPPESPSIAVLPFVNMSSDPEQEYFSDGVTEEILNRLAKLSGLQVAARTSSFQFKDRAADMGEIGAALNVNHVLEGSVRKAGERVRVTAQLIAVDSNFHLWSETYERELTDVFAIQDEISSAIAAALEVALIDRPDDAGDAGAGTGPVAAQPRTIDAEVFDLYLRGRHLLYQREADNLIGAVSLFDRALAIDPAFADAWAYKAFALALLPAYEKGEGTAPQHLPVAIDAGERALAIDPENVIALTALGHAQSHHGWDLELARAYLEKAYALAPNNVDVVNLYGDHLAVSARFDEALAIEQRAQELDPLSPVHPSDFAYLAGLLGLEEQAVAAARRAVDLAPAAINRIDAQIFAYTAVGRTDEARMLIDDAIRRTPDSANAAPLWRALVLVREGRIDELRPLLEQLTDESRELDGYRASPTEIAFVAFAVDGPAGALPWLERAVAERDHLFAWPAYFFRADGYSDAPAWQAFWARPEIAQLLERQHASTGSDRAGLWMLANQPQTGDP